MIGTIYAKIARKLNIFSIPELVLYAVRTKLIPLADVSEPIADSEAVRVRFEFPDSVRTACEQYLLYFAQFLKDLGVDVEAQIEERAGDTLFSVVPTDKEQALDRIREALDVYLQMPSAPDFNIVASKFSDVAVSQLQANVLQLQSQLMLATAAIDLKNAILEVKNVQIESLKERIELVELEPQVEAVSERKDKEPIIPGLVSVKKYDFKFLEFDFPNLLRKLKRRLR